MRNLLINLTFIFTLITFSFTNAFSQVELLIEFGNPVLVYTDDLAVIKGEGLDATVYRGSGIVVPIIPKNGGTTVMTNVMVLKGRGNVIYSYSASYESGQAWEFIIPDSELSSWESGSYTLTLRVGAHLVIQEIIVIE